MKKRNIRQITAILALIELISGNCFMDTAHAVDTKIYYVINEDGKVEKIDNYDVILHHQKTEIEDGDIITPFNEKNNYSRQYGGDQVAFERSFNSLIKDPVIWRILQDYIPEDTFESKEFAMEFYRKYFTEFSRSSCGHVAVCNKIFSFFDGREEEFEKVFGYPMYTIDENNVINYNYEYLIFDFANYSFKSLGKLDEIKHMFDKTVAGMELRRYEYTQEYLDKPILDHDLTKEEVELINKINDHHHELEKKYKKATDKDISLALPLNKNLGNLKKFLKEHRIDATIAVDENYFRTYQKGDIIASENFTVYKENNDKEIYSQSDNVGPHYMYVVDVEGNRVVVSTWGEKYYFVDAEADWVTKVKIRLKYKGRAGY